MTVLRSLWRRFVAWLAYNFPSDEQLEAQDTPELRAFHNRMEQRRAAKGIR